MLDLWASTAVFKELAIASSVKVIRDTTRLRFRVVGRNNANTTASKGYQMFLDYVRIADPVANTQCRQIELARRWFDLGDIPNLSITIDDGAIFLRRAPAAAWDAIVVDAFDGRELAAPFASRAFFADVRRALRPGGGFALNVIGVLGGAGVLQEVERAVRSELEDVRLVPVLDPGEAYAPMAQRNVVVLARSSTRAY